MSSQPKSHTRDDPLARREQILDEAIRIIGERGYYGFAVQDLAGRCGLTTAGLLYHFKTKEQLFMAVLSERDRRAEEALMRLLASFPVENFAKLALPLGEVVTLLRAVLEITVAQPELSRLFVVLGAESLHKSHPGYAYFRRREERVIEMLARIVGAHVVDPRSTARQISALMLGLQQQWLGADGEWDLLAQWDQAIAKVLPEPDSKVAQAK
ncbi:MAG: TetR/AcrR family transcriptional regulator [Novosphingobium sp.]